MAYLSMQPVKSAVADNDQIVGEISRIIKKVIVINTNTHLYCIVLATVLTGVSVIFRNMVINIRAVSSLQYKIYALESEVRFSALFPPLHSVFCIPGYQPIGTQMMLYNFIVFLWPNRLPGTW